MREFLKRVKLLFTLETHDLQEITKLFQEEMARGLRGEKSSLKMLPAYVGRPRGTEKGAYIVLDMGGTNFRIMKVELDGKRGERIESVQRHVIPSRLRQGKREELFDFLAHHLRLFLEKNKCQEEALAFTFSFPVEQKSISSGLLLRWTKGFTVPGVEGEDVAFLLAEALKRQGLSHLRLSVLLNDTVGTLLAASYRSPLFDLAVILGTGTNACYPEKTDHIKIEGPVIGNEVIINLEWGNFNRLPRNEYDCLLDCTTPNPGEQQMEKMVSGLYIGELARLILFEMEGDKTYRYRKPYSLSARRLTALVSCPTKTPGPIKEIADIVFTRSARIVAASMVAVITWMDPGLKNRHAIAIDGALFTGYSGFRQTIEQTFEELLPGKSHLIELKEERDGSGIGAAVACAICDEMAKSF